MLMACGGHLRKPNGLEDVVACPQGATEAAAGTALLEVDMAPAQEGGDTAHQVAEVAMDHHHVGMAGV